MAVYMVCKKSTASHARNGSVTNINGCDAVIISADTLQYAQDLAEALFDGDSGWSGSAGIDCTATSTDWTNFRWRVKIARPGGGANIVDVNHKQNGATTDTIMNALVTKLNATPYIKNAAHVNGTRVLTIAGAADNIGDHYCVLEITYEDATHGGTEKPMTTLVTSYVRGGAAGAALSVTTENMAVMPKVIRKCRTVIY